MAEGEDKLINVVLKYSQQGAEDVAQSQVLMGKAADDYYKKQAQTWDTLGKDFQDFQNNYGKGAQTMVQTTRGLSHETENLAHQFHALRMAGFELRQIGTFFTLFGGLLTAGLVADANNYVKTVGNINVESAKWLEYENKIKSANLEIGATATQALLPAMAAAAGLIQRVADIVKENPWIISGALTVGGALLALGVATRVIGELVRVVADIGLLLTKAGVLQAAGGAGGGLGLAPGIGATLGVVTLTATSVIIGAELGQALGNYLGRLIYGETYQKQNIQDALITLGKIFQLPWIGLANIIAKLDPSLTGAMNKFITFENDLDAWVGKMIGASRYQGTAGGVGDVGAQQQQITQNEVQDFINFQKQMADASKNYSQQRADTVQQYEQQIADVTANYERQRAETIANFEQQQAREARDFGQQQALALRNYNEQIQKSSRDFAMQEQRSRAQHNLEMQRLEQTHNLRVNELVAQRDALGLVKENQNYQIQRSQKEQDFSIQQAQSRQDHARQLQDQRQAFEQQRADALAAFNQRLADQQQDEQQRLAQMDAAHKLEMEKLAQQEKEKLAKLSESYKAQVDTLQTAFVDRLRALDNAILGDTAAFNRYMQREAQQFQTWLNNYQAQHAASSIMGPHQAGGYASFFGPGEDGRPEFIASHNTTKALETIMGGRLSQAALIATALAARGGSAGAGGNALHVTVTGRSLSMSEIRARVDEAMDQRLSELLPAFGA